MEIGGPSLQKHTITKDHVSIEITNADINLISSIKEKMGCISLSHCISRVPQQLSKENEEKYFPSLVSIGPFHNHGLKAMEDQKWRYLNALLSRKPNAEQILDTCIRALREVEKKVRNFYTESINIGSDEFVEMLLVDGCFIIELFLEFSIKSLRRRDDPFLSSNDTIQRLRCDLILFENQIPFFVLDQIFHLVPIPKQCQISLFELALCFFRKLIPGDHSQFNIDIFAPQTHHLLDLIRQHYLPTVPKVKVLSGVGQSHIHRATHLVASGIRVEKSISESPSDITFFNGELKIPSLEFHVYTEILLRNLVAMEHCDPRCSKHVTSYATLMKRLIQSKRDVRLLQEKDILIGHGHEREGQVVHLFQRLNVDINEEDFYYKGICEQINGYQTRGKQVSWKNIRHSYYKSHLGIVGLSLGMLFVVVLFTAGLISALYFLLHHFQ
ncbi:upf0481 protein at3g47200 [Phtheirospermum japonicum]|uniref:Upf0481 protein at3g47200 n=1 Tax=Phtheirospermum japonicum TaxID=374723 RepID=A0A830D5U5_9LAMI|nr:upf0481 protein at3g47200 [Phtheirospermum japonicum]